MRDEIKFLNHQTKRMKKYIYTFLLGMIVGSSVTGHSGTARSRKNWPNNDIAKAVGAVCRRSWMKRSANEVKEEMQKNGQVVRPNQTPSRLRMTC
jgi:hypothetical protein